MIIKKRLDTKEGIIITLLIFFIFALIIEVKLNYDKRNFYLEEKWICGAWDKYEKNIQFACFNKPMEDCNPSDNKTALKLNTFIERCICQVGPEKYNYAERICSKKVDIYHIKDIGYNLNIEGDDKIESINVSSFSFNSHKPS